MSPKVAFSAILCAAACIGSAQSVSFDFQGEGARQVWIAPQIPTAPPGDTDGISTKQATANLPASGQKDTALVLIWDKATGNLASKTLKDATTTPWTVKPTDFQDVAQVAVHLDHLGKPVAAATIDLNDGRRTTTQLLDPSSNGTVTFFGVKPGSLKITAHFKVAGKDASPITQLMDVSLIRSVPVPTQMISIGDAVETVGTTAPATATTPGAPAGDATKPASKDTAKEPDSVLGFIGKLIVYVLVLAGMAGLIYYAIGYIKKNPDTVGSKLEQLGVQIPKPGDDPLTNPVPIPLPKAPAPVQKIILGDAAPDLIAPVSASTVVSDPRLVSQNGDAMPLPEGDLIVGREVGLGLSLVGESTVSRKHAQLSRSGGSVIVKDFGSTNGTFINGVQIQGEKQLQVGDTVQFGSVRFRFEG